MNLEMDRIETVTGEQLLGMVAPLDLGRLVLIDSQLALAIRSLVEMSETGDWDAARVMAHTVAQRVRILELTTRADEAGVVR